jgi:hypothetical protein
VSARGGTLAEALVALGLAALVLCIALGIHDDLRRTFGAGRDAAERQQSARIALDWIEGDLRLAGFGIDPDGATGRPDEPVEAAASTAIIVRADFDAQDAALASVPERALEGAAFAHVSTGNDEMRGFVLRPMRGAARERLSFEADVRPAPRDGVVEPVVLDGIALTPDAPPYTLYRVSLDADVLAYGTARLLHYTPVIDDVTSLRFRYFDPAGREIPAPGGVDTEAGRSARAAIAQIGVEIEVVGADQRTLRLVSRVRLPNGPTRTVRPRRRSRRRPSRESGIALVVVLCVACACAFVALALVLIGETENLVARNEKRASQTRAAAEAGSRLVLRWFDDPRGAPLRPTPADVDRTLRRIRDEANPSGPTLGSTPRYKERVDLDGDGIDDLFDRPYEGAVVDALRGTLDGPDLRIDGARPAGAAFLERLSASLFGTFPGEGGGMRLRISRIDLSAPPYLASGPSWTRAGIGTVRVTARLERETPGGREVVAEHTVETILGEVPYRRITGPIHSCAETVWTGTVGVHWGTLASVGPLVVSGPPFVATSVPRSTPPDAIRDPVWNLTDPAAFGAFVSAVAGVSFPDPWFRILSGGDVLGVGAPPGVVQPFPPALAPDRPDRSNLFQSRTDVRCPALDYQTFRSIARSGRRGVHYFAWDGAAFREDGTEAPTTIEDALRGAAGLFFFDTADGEPPRDRDGDGRVDNLTPAEEIGGALVFRGVIFANASSIRLLADAVPGGETSLEAPGEPYQDFDRDGGYDAGESHLDLLYPTASGDVARPIVAGPPGGVREDRGPTIPGVSVAIDGIVITSGLFEATGRGTVYGSIVARSGITQSPADGTAPSPEVYWNATIHEHGAEARWHVPRVMVLGQRFDP